jgi:hypothetical protein
MTPAHTPLRPQQNLARAAETNLRMLGRGLVRPEQHVISEHHRRRRSNTDSKNGRRSSAREQPRPGCGGW